MEEKKPMRADEVLQIEPVVHTLTAGTSMRPMLRQGRDVVVVERVSRPLRVGDAPLYRKVGKDKLVLHRIVKITDKGYVIRGDNLYFNEYDVTDDDIVGVLKAFYREGKYVDCATNRLYRFYWHWRIADYPLRKYIYRPIRKMLSFVKHKIFRL